MQKGFCAVQIIAAAQRGAAHKSDNCGCAVQIIVAAQRGVGVSVHDVVVFAFPLSPEFCPSVLLRFIYAPLSFSRLLLPISP